MLLAFHHPSSIIYHHHHHHHPNPSEQPLSIPGGHHHTLEPTLKFGSDPQQLIFPILHILPPRLPSSSTHPSLSLFPPQSGRDAAPAITTYPGMYTYRHHTYPCGYLSQCANQGFCCR
ncbi:hypothetical protein K456DRAFT_51763 [Colletotrichum gloeosporioides 23]|nr:hypothetical protein K456DRAFT_51763 [Colletotrichum gloeosporioides 23]